MFNRRFFLSATATMALSATMCLAASAQTTTLRDPLIPGAPSEPAFVPPPDGQIPPVGDGPTPVGINPGMTGPPTLLPWNINYPVNDVDLANSGIPLNVGPAIASPPGVLGPSLTPFIPPAPSTPGADPGELTAPAGSFNPAVDLNIIPTGGLPGTGGYNTTIPKVRRGGQEAHQWELRGRNSIFGGGGDSQDEVTETGVLAGMGLPFGVPTGNGYNKGPAGTNNDLRNSSIDLGGGQRFKIGGQVIPTGSTVQDFGLSSLRDNGVLGLGAQQSTEFGQGFRHNGIFSNNSTDFGLPYSQFIPANEDAQKTGQLLLPTAVETNF